MVGVVERTPLDRVAELDLDLLVAEAVPLIAGILDALDPAGRRAGRPMPAGGRPRWAGCDPVIAPAPRSLATSPSSTRCCSSQLAEAARVGGASPSSGATPNASPSCSARCTERSPRVWSASGIPPLAEHEPGALPGGTDLDRWLAVLVAEHRRYGRPFALALLELDGLGRIFETHGRRPGELMLTAASTVIRNQIRIVDHAFKLDGDAFCVVAPNVDAGRLRQMADRVSRVVEASQAADGPRIAISAGISSCPEHGHEAGRLLEIAGDALGAAKASGEPVQVALDGARSSSPA